MGLTEVFRMSIMEADTYLAPSSYLGSERKHVHQKTLNTFLWISSLLLPHPALVFLRLFIIVNIPILFSNYVPFY